MSLRNGYVYDTSTKSTVIPGRIASTSAVTLHLNGSYATDKVQNSSAQYMRATMTNGKARWTCRICGKMLSSKRSFDEHSNIHNRARPFQCEHCDYAAASQMTLRRHNLRNHTPRQAWGYQCPYCPELYMEPASYQQHVGSRHFGKSATFGCPLEGCSFTTLSCGYFRDHLSKHRNLPRAYMGYTTVENISLSRFIVEDRLGIFFQSFLGIMWVGVGFGKRPLKQIVRPSFLKKAAEEEREYQEYMKTPINCDRLRSFNRKETTNTKQNVALRFDRVTTPFEEVNEEDGIRIESACKLFDGQRWIVEDVGCLEVVVGDDNQATSKILHEGMVEPDLD
ncbi:unnamed protein product [Anisakis simplex]|uniref:C2H2-type domain-containing protein n=1 Tax=Anisakis simplex TaxID=6269 RepID=A0A0M3JX05_ANISI|nr:unnamed protein product [Anisakis simplex]